MYTRGKEKQVAKRFFLRRKSMKELIFWDGEPIGDDDENDDEWG